MNNKKPWRRFLPDTPLHNYQRSSDCGVLFYDEILMVEHFMIFCTNARIYGVTILALTYILTHLHSCCMASCEENYIKCLSFTSISFAKRVRDYWHHSQPFFKHGIEYAVKRNPKSVRSCLNYIANNAPEKKLCNKAIEYRWNFLRYAQSDHPYSSPYIADKASKKMEIARGVITRMRAANEVPSIEQLVKFRGSLNTSEWRQLVDYIITQYSAIDYEKASSYFGSLDKMLVAPDSNLGEEHDINETYDTNTYVPYYEMCKVVFDRNELWNPFDKELVAKKFRQIWKTKNSTIRDIAFFLHISEDEVDETISHLVFQKELAETE